MTDERLATPLRRRAPQSRWWLAMLGGLLLGMSLILLAHRWGFADVSAWVVPAFLFAVSLVLVWSPLESAVQSDARRPDVVALFSREAWARVVLGMALAIVTLVWFSRWEFSDDPILRALLMPVVIVVALALLLAPWWMRLIRQVGVERERRVREFERAEIAAHLHDSVLQTLTLIRAKAADPDAVARLARAQERDLRAYLYQDRRTEEESVAAALQKAVSEVEDARGVAVDVVHVGDAPTSQALRAAVKAAREAVQNAARHGQEPISVYAELTADRYEVFVRDSGPGFDPAAVPADRAGIRNSIVGRAHRYGGEATIASSPGGRTEVTISFPRQEER